jgi:hypothetical protein
MRPPRSCFKLEAVWIPALEPASSSVRALNRRSVARPAPEVLISCPLVMVVTIV